MKNGIRLLLLSCAVLGASVHVFGDQAEGSVYTVGDAPTVGFHDTAGANIAAVAGSVTTAGNVDIASDATHIGGTDGAAPVGGSAGKAGGAVPAGNAGPMAGDAQIVGKTHVVGHAVGDEALDTLVSFIHKAQAEIERTLAHAQRSKHPENQAAVPVLIGLRDRLVGLTKELIASRPGILKTLDDETDATIKKMKKVQIDINLRINAFDTINDVMQEFATLLKKAQETVSSIIVDLEEKRVAQKALEQAIEEAKEQELRAPSRNNRMVCKRLHKKAIAL